MRATARVLVEALCCLVIVATLVPFAPMMPSAGLDASWHLALNQAVAHDFAFGQDYVFTYGPYGFVITCEYSPATDLRMVLACLLLAACHIVALRLCWRGRPSIADRLLALVVLALAAPFREGLIFFYVAMVFHVLWRLMLPAEHPQRLAPGRATTVTVAVLLIPFGLLPLVKGSFILPVGMLCALGALCLGRSWLAACVVVVPAASLVFFWLAAGQALTGLPAYFGATLAIISGYTEAMALPGPRHEILIFLAASLVVLYGAWALPGTRKSRLFLVAAYAGFLLVIAKAAFVRHDVHALIGGFTLVLIAVPMGPLLDGRLRYTVLAPVLLAGLYLAHNYWPLTLDKALTAQSQLLRGLRIRLTAPAQLRQAFDASLAAIARDRPLRRFPGSWDIYPTDQARLLASGQDWAPRPIMQSYSAYNPELAALNARHLLGDRAPDNIVFSVAPEGYRLPALEDGPSWPLLLNRYAIHDTDGDSLYLRKRPPAQIRDPLPEPAFYDRRHDLGEEVVLPDEPGPLFAELDVRPTVVGTMFLALFKVPPLTLSLRLAGGATVGYRLASGNARAGFILSPVIATTLDFLDLASPGDALAANRVTRLRVDGDRPFWARAYGLRLSRLDLIRDATVQLTRAAPSAAVSAPPAGACDGWLDHLNGTRLTGDGPVQAHRELHIDGWLALSTKTGDVSDATLVTLTDERGAVILVASERLPRPDVAAHFALPALAATGFTATVDVRALHGRYQLGLATVHRGTLRSCPTPTLPLILGAP